MQKIICFVALIFVGIFGSALDMPALDKHIISSLSQKQDTTWLPGVNEYFVGKTVAQAKKLMGFVPNPTLKAKMPVRSERLPNIPSSFNSTTQWPQCTTISTIFNQAECGSCWAFGCVEAASDRMCIHLGKKFNYALSFMEQTTCNPNCYGCEGGDPYSAFNFIAETGLVSGECYPYTIPTCPPAQQPCLNFVATPPCLSSCNSTGATWTPMVFNSSYAVESSVEAIQTEIMTNGPVEACFDVYQDFLTYKSGVYQYQTGSLLGGHCIKMIGWGVENGTPYWLCNNSWTTYWGDDGQFKILRGQDECGIEDMVAAGLPSITSPMS